MYFERLQEKFETTRQHEKCFVVYLGNEISLTAYLSITDSFFLWWSQRKRLIYVDAIFVSVVAPILYTLSLLTRFIPTKPMSVTQLPFSMNRWLPFFLEPRMTISVFSTNDHSVDCCHARFVFPGTLKKAVTIPVTEFCVIYRLRILLWSFSPTSPSGAFVNFLVWHQLVVDPITIESFENCVCKKPRWMFSSHLFCITLPSHKPTSNLYHAFEVLLYSFSFFLKFLWASKTHDSQDDALVTTGTFFINFCSNQCKCAKRSTLFHSHSHVQAESI